MKKELKSFISLSTMNNVIVIGTTHHNSLGVIRALGERGYGVEFVNFGGRKRDYVSIVSI